MGNKS